MDLDIFLFLLALIFNIKIRYRINDMLGLSFQDGMKQHFNSPFPRPPQKKKITQTKRKKFLVMERTFERFHLK